MSARRVDYASIGAIDTPDPLSVVFHLQWPDAGMLANFVVNEGAARGAGAPLRVASARPLSEYPVRNLSESWQPVLALGRWYHLAGVYRRDRIELYVDGARVAWAPLAGGGGSIAGAVVIMRDALNQR